jgi:hypothetical protein
MKNILILVSSLSFFISCNVKSESNEAKYSYNLTNNGCPTGERIFSSFEAYCAGLKSEADNGGCAREMRREIYNNANCSGDFDSGN